jgi:hypothetical protein
MFRNWQFHRADGGYFSAKMYEFCGVYRSIALETDGASAKPAVLNRVCGQDTIGTL